MRVGLDGHSCGESFPPIGIDRSGEVCAKPSTEGTIEGEVDGISVEVGGVSTGGGVDGCCVTVGCRSSIARPSCRVFSSTVSLKDSARAAEVVLCVNVDVKARIIFCSCRSLESDELDRAYSEVSCVVCSRRKELWFDA